MNWKPHAAALAAGAVPSGSRWRAPVALLPRHLFIPCWWAGQDSWSLRAGADDEEAWLTAAYADDSLVTRVGSTHADQAQPGDRPAGRPTSSATLPSLLVRMFQHARLSDGDTLLDVGTGSGYGTALACVRLGDHRVTSIDVDPYLTEAAGQRLTQVGLGPQLYTLDASGELPEHYDRIVATVGVRPVPTSWLTALKPGGRLVTNIAGTTLIVTADKQEDGTARGRVEWDRAGFMHARHSADYPPLLDGLVETACAERGSSSRSADIRWSTSNRHGTCRPCSASRYPASSTATRRPGSSAQRGSPTRTAHGPEPPARRGAILSYTRAVHATCGTFWMRSVRTGFSTASCPCAAPMC